MIFFLPIDSRWCFLWKCAKWCQKFCIFHHVQSIQNILKRISKPTWKYNFFFHLLTWNLPFPAWKWRKWCQKFCIFPPCSIDSDFSKTYFDTVFKKTTFFPHLYSNSAINWAKNGGNGGNGVENVAIFDRAHSIGFFPKRILTPRWKNKKKFVGIGVPLTLIK